MKRFVIASALAAATTLTALPALAQMGVSVDVAAPGLYGRIDIGGMPAPQLLYPRPVVIEQAPVMVQREPIYLHVPPAYSHDWRRYCHVYNACGQPVYFVQDNWYSQVYVPHYHAVPHGMHAGEVREIRHDERVVHAERMEHREREERRY